MVPTIRKVLSSVVSVLLNRREIRRAVPTMEMSEISANTEDKKENKYKEAKADAAIPKSIK